MLKAFNNILIVVKQTPYEQYLQLKAQGRAPVALRWERLKNRYNVHKTCVDDVTNIIDNIGIKYSIIGREELHRGSIQDRDLVIAVGGDGTVLNTASFIDDSIPILGVNSDPSRLEEIFGDEKKDERRSRGALCGITATNVHATLPQILYGDISPGLRSRIQCLVRSTYTETRLPPSLNDLLITQPIPAAVSRFRLALCKGKAKPSFNINDDEDELFSFNVWSSGMWIATPSGSSAAIFNAGGFKMDIRSRNLQYMVREHMIEEGMTHHLKSAGHSIIRPDEMLKLRWNSQNGAVYVDGQHFKHNLELGDEIRVDSHAPYLKIFDQLSPASSAGTLASAGAHFTTNSIAMDNDNDDIRSGSNDNSSSRSSYAKGNDQKSIDSGGVLNDDPFA
eukprot:gene13176-15187_t